MLQLRQPTKNDLDAHEMLKARLRINGTSLAQLSRELGVTDSALTLVGKRMCRSRKIERALADALGVTPESLFPDHGEGEPK
jgi:lambda repressor-like predicted transcriptional regulator